MKPAGKLLAIVFLVGIAFAGGFWFAKRASATAQPSGRKILYWVDPMHPAYKSDRPGIAPDCGMKLEPVYADQKGPAAPHAHRQVKFYRDPKQPSYTSKKPGINPETGNDLEPVYEDMEALPPNAIHIPADKQQLIGVTFATAETSAAVETVRAAGRVAQDETRVTRVHPKTEGWVYQTMMDFNGQSVKTGDPLLTLYSPDMFSTEREFLLALRARDTMKSGPSREAYENSELLIEAARRRLELWDLSTEQIAEIERTRQPVRTVTLFSPASGYVVSRNAFPSQRVSPETELYVIADLSRVWIMADVYESDMAKVHLGQAAIVTPPQPGSPSLNAKVTYIQPQADATMRTMKVRLEAENQSLALKPDMFLNVDFRIGLPSRVTVPADAVLNSGDRRTVFVDRGNGYLEPREVQTGEQTGDRIQIVSGLRAGERVVASGAFLIDSEAQMRNPQQGAHQHD
jgi:RND family efflux transporter MFP subunit